MKAVIAVVGLDRVGILAKISGVCFENSVNVIDVNQTVMQNYFAMTMLVDISALNGGFGDFVQTVTEAGSLIGVKVHVMHEDIFNSMHRI